MATVPETVPSEDEGGPGLSLLETWRRGTRVRVTLLSINGHVANRRRSMQAEVLNPARARTTGYRSVTSPQTNGPTFLGVASGTTPPLSTAESPRPERQQRSLASPDCRLCSLLGFPGISTSPRVALVPMTFPSQLGIWATSYPRQSAVSLEKQEWRESQRYTVLLCRMSLCPSPR